MQCPRCNAEVEKETFFCPSCGTLFSEKTEVGIAQAESAQVLGGRYVILSPLGRGGMGAVYLARDTQLDKVVAVKLLPPEIASDLRAVEWMKEEVRIAQDVRHEHVAAMYNFEIDPQKQLCFIVMEFINGVDLHTVLARSEGERLALETAVRILKECSDALSYAHSKRIIHRDIKPKNVMVTRDGLVKVMDFGIARRLHETMSKISQTMVAGTPMYMAPEHLMGGKIDSRADIYSLGAMVYELLNGTPPFHKGKIDIQILEKEVPPLEASLFEGDEELTNRVNAVLRKCLAKEPDDRYDTAVEFYEALRQAAGIEEEQPGAAESLNAAVEAALVDQREMLAQTASPASPLATPFLSLSAFEPTQRTPLVPATPVRRSRLPVFIGLGCLLVAAFIALTLAAPWRSRPAEEPGTADNVEPVAEGPPKLAIAEFIVEGDSGTNTPMSLANTVMYRVQKKIEDKYEIIEPLQLKGILESLGMKVTQLTDHKSAKRLYTERGIRYLILCTLVKGAWTELEGRMIDLKDGRVVQQDKPYVRYAPDIRRGAEKLGDILALDDAHKKIYFLLSEAGTHRARGEFDEAMAKIEEALKLDDKDKSIHEYKVEFTEAIARDAVSKCGSRRFTDAMDRLRAARKYNFSPETVKQLPDKIFEAIVKKGEREFGYRQYKKAIETYEWALKIKDDPAVRERIEAAKKEQEK